MEKGKVLIQQISDLYEQHKAEKKPLKKKKEIYKKIDAISQEASKYAIANEYDKAISSWASGTNAHTWFDETVYKNNIPSNELVKMNPGGKERFPNWF